MKKPREVIQLRWGVYMLRMKAQRMVVCHRQRRPEARGRALKEYPVEPFNRRASASSARRDDVPLDCVDGSFSQSEWIHV
jgi:hypothetical protein